MSKIHSFFVTTTACEGVGTSCGGTSTTWTGSSGVRRDSLQLDGSSSLSSGHIAKRADIGNPSSQSMPPKRTVCYVLGNTLPCTLYGYGNRTAMVLLLTNDEEACILSKLLVVGRSIGNTKRVGQWCVRETEELRR